MRHPFFNLTHLVLREGESDFSRAASGAGAGRHLGAERRDIRAAGNDRQPRAGRQDASAAVAPLDPEARPVRRRTQHLHARDVRRRRRQAQHDQDAGQAARNPAHGGRRRRGGKARSRRDDAGRRAAAAIFAAGLSVLQLEGGVQIGGVRRLDDELGARALRVSRRACRGFVAPGDSCVFRAARWCGASGWSRAKAAISRWAM